MNNETNTTMTSTSAPSAAATLHRSALTNPSFARFGLEEIIRKASAGKESVAKTDCKRRIGGELKEFKAGETIPAIPRDAKVVGVAFNFVPATLADVKAEIKAKGLKGKEARELRQQFFHGDHVNAANQTSSAFHAAVCQRGGVWYRTEERNGEIIMRAKLPDSVQRETPAERALRAENEALKQKLESIEAMLGKLTAPQE